MITSARSSPAVLIAFWLYAALTSASDYAGSATCDARNSTCPEVQQPGRDHLLMQVERSHIAVPVQQELKPYRSGETTCQSAKVSRRRRDGEMCSCRRRNGPRDGWTCSGDTVAKDESYVPPPTLPTAGVSSDSSVKVMSYNVMGWSACGRRRRRNLPGRGIEITKKIKYWDPAVLGAQEVETGGGSGGDDCEAALVANTELDRGLYKKSVLQRLEPGSSWTKLVRGYWMAGARYKHIKSGNEFLLFNSHWKHGYGMEQAKIVANAIDAERRKYGSPPTLFMGDTNQFCKGYDSDAYKYLTGQIGSSPVKFADVHAGDWEGSFGNGDCRVDFIFASGGQWSLVDAVIDRNGMNGAASDHAALIAVLVPLVSSGAMPQTDAPTSLPSTDSPTDVLPSPSSTTTPTSVPTSPPTASAEASPSCCGTSTPFYSTRSRKCYPSKARWYYKNCDAISQTQAAGASPNCCGASMTFYSPRSGNCYPTKAKGYYKSCDVFSQTPLPTLAPTSMSLPTTSSSQTSLPTLVPTSMSVPTSSQCMASAVQRRRRQEEMCSCRRRSGWSDGGWRCVNDIVVGTTPVWSDEFDNAPGDDRLNSSKWGHYIGPNPNNKERQYYTDRPDNYRVNNGVVTIIGRRESYKGMDYTSASIKTKGLGDWGPGHRIEVRAKLPMGVGTWPAIWMLPTDKVYGGWPDSGEIDIMEAVGRSPNKIFGTVHTGAYNHMRGTHKGKNYYTDPAQWHTYSIDWEETQIKWYVDGNHYNTFAPSDTSNSQKWPFSQRFFLIINLAIGGTLGGSVRFGSREQVMEVDYVRVYCLDGGQSCKTPSYSCCNNCKNMPFCSPQSRQCYANKNKEYYESCSLPELAEAKSMIK